MQLNIGHLDESGVYTGSFSTFALCGAIRAKVRKRVYMGGRGDVVMLLWQSLCAWGYDGDKRVFSPSGIRKGRE